MALRDNQAVEEVIAKNMSKIRSNQVALEPVMRETSNARLNQVALEVLVIVKPRHRGTRPVMWVDEFP